jgi:hypothetical protein
MIDDFITLDRKRSPHHYVEHDFTSMGSSFSEFDYQSCHNQEGIMVISW